MPPRRPHEHVFTHRPMAGVWTCTCGETLFEWEMVEYVLGDDADA